MTCRLVRARDHTATGILSQEAGGQSIRKEDGNQASRIAAQDGMAATGTQLSRLVRARSQRFPQKEVVLWPLDSALFPRLQKQQR